MGIHTECNFFALEGHRNHFQNKIFQRGQWTAQLYQQRQNTDDQIAQCAQKEIFYELQSSLKSFY